MSEEMSKQSEVLRIRPHHGLCTAFFRGEGYSGSFVENMAQITDLLGKNDPDIIITEGADDICKECPELWQGSCRSEKSDKYDRMVLNICGFSYGERISWKEFSDIIRKRIIYPEKLDGICKDCRWFYICSDKSTGDLKI